MSEDVYARLDRELAHGDRPRINIGLIGPARIGKTTMLGSMVERFNDVLGDTMVLTPLSDAARDARKDAVDPWTVRLQETPGLELPVSDVHPPTRALTFYRYGLRVRKSLGTEVEILFTDMPGEWFENEHSDSWRATARLVSGCDVLVVPVDVPALRTDRAEVIQARNGPARLYRLFVSIRESLTDPASHAAGPPGGDSRPVDGWQILLTPIRCERWRTDEVPEAQADPHWRAAQDALHERQLRHWYRQWLALVKQTWPTSDFSVVPVQTVGSIMYLRQEGTRTVFRKKSEKVVAAAPLETEQPLLRILSRILVVQQEGLPAWWRPSGLWNRLIGTQGTLAEARAAVDRAIVDGGGAGPLTIV